MRYPLPEYPVVSYTTFSPLPGCPGGIFSVALSIPLAHARGFPVVKRDILPYGVRTFLSAT